MQLHSRIADLSLPLQLDHLELFCHLGRGWTSHVYRAQARALKSRWVQGGRSTAVEIVFNDTVRARET